MPVHQLNLAYDDSNGQIQVSGVVPNKGLCYMILALAHDAIREWHEKNRKVATPTAQDLANFAGPRQ